jgi:hypothetical protein
VYGSPVEPPPEAVISQKPSDPPAPAAAPPANGWVARLRRAVARLLGD